MIVLRTSTETRTRSTKHGTERYTVTTTHYTVDVNCPCQTARNAFSGGLVLALFAVL